MGQAQAADGGTIGDLIASVGGACSRLVDAWEATALIESFGYTDARVQREFGFSDTRTLGLHVFEELERRPRLPAAVAEDERRAPLADFLPCVTSAVVYAVPWLVTFVAERGRPDVLRVPGHAAPSLAIAFMVSLIVSGGFVQAISRRGQFYIGMDQPGLAALVCRYLFRLGGIVTVAVALMGLLLGWYFGIFSWPYLILAADEFIILSLLWMTLGMISVRHEQWRVPFAFLVGAVAFIVVRSAGRDALMAQLVASAAMLAIGLVQVPSVFASETADVDGDVPLPRLTVLLYAVLPFFWYGAAYFCFLFADRFAASASVAALTGAPFGMRPEYKLGMDVALLTFLLASAGIEYANIRFTRGLTAEIRATPLADAPRLRGALRLLHLRSLAIVAGTFVLVASIVRAIAHRLLPPQPSAVWTTLLLGDAGYLLLALGLLNALVLFSLDRPWTALKALVAGLAVNIAVGYISSHVFDTYFAAAGLVAGASLMCVVSTVCVHMRLARADHAVAV